MLLHFEHKKLVFLSFLGARQGKQFLIGQLSGASGSLIRVHCELAAGRVTVKIKCILSYTQAQRILHLLQQHTGHLLMCFSGT